MKKRLSQCKAKYFLIKEGQCQGCSGHKGHHWFYDPTGSLIQWANKKDPKSQYSGSRLMKKYGGFGSSWTPPDHKAWIHPKKMTKKSFKWAKYSKPIKKR